MSEIVYIICQYNDKSSGRILNTPPAGVTYVNYLIQAIKETGRRVSVVSTSSGKSRSYFTKKTVLVDNTETHIYLPTFKQGPGLILRLEQVICYLQLCLFFLCKVSKNDRIILYHDRGLSLLYHFAKNVIKRRYYILVGEIFSAVYDKGDVAIKKEINNIHGAKGYILINNLMPKLLGGISNYCVCHGNYQLCQISVSDCKDNLIHVVYAGKIDQNNVTDAFMAVAASEFLDSRYRLHILGYGVQEDICALENKINEVNKNTKEARVSYDGCLFGEEYDKFLMRCHIGLCSRTLTEDRSNLCFPSKTVVYLTHGLNIVAPDCPVLRTSYIANYISYIKGDATPENMAKAIMEVKLSDIKDKINAVNKLNRDFVLSLNSMLTSKV